MQLKNVLTFSLLLMTAHPAFSGWLDGTGKDAGESVKAGFDNLAGSLANSGKDAASAVNNVAGAGNNVAGSVNNVAGAINNTADKVGRTATSLFGLGVLWSAGASVKSWVWPSRSDKVVAMSTNETYAGLSAKCALKSCMKANINAPRDKFGFPIPCRDQAAEFAFQAGRNEAKEMGATFNEFYPQEA